MAKAKKNYYCQECGYESPKWLGQCPACKQWNTFVEEPKVTIKSKHARVQLEQDNKPIKLKDIVIEDERRMSTQIGELDRVLGGGIVTGSLILVGGDPGIGKSTLLLQMCENLSQQTADVLYISGEESLQQIKLRANRLSIDSHNLTLYSETNLESIEQVIKANKPDTVIIDSIQTIYNPEITSAPGSVSQVRDVTGLLMRLAKGLGVSIFIVGHVTKDGSIAGPRVLEHIVDTVLYFEGQRNASYRVLRAVKNRFGSTNEIGVFEMRDIGLTEVKDPSAYLLSGRPMRAAGSIVSCCMEGTRAMLAEVQALVSPTNFGMPRRTATGTDYNRVVLLMAVLEKKLGMQLAGYDSYVNIAGGMKVSEPSLDLAISIALASSFKNKPILDYTVIMGEVGLTGEVRGISMIEKRILECKKLGFKRCIIPESNQSTLTQIDGILVIGVKNLEQALTHCF